jgi:branched-chain amino acid aminotransferase
MNYFNCNGKIFAEGTLVVGADSRALRYGDGLFETIKMKDGNLVLEDEHFARLWKGMSVLQFDLPKHFTPDKLQKEIIVLAKKNNQENNARIRLNVFRGDGGLYDAKNYLPNYIIQSWLLPDNNGEWNSNGLVLGIYEEAKKSCDILSNLKHNNYLPYILGALKAKKEKWNDAVILNTQSNICDTTIANIFLIKDDVIFTPSLKEGCVAGIMRKKIIQELMDRGWQIIEKEITKTDLQNADEIFLTNSIYNIRWVRRIEDTVYANTITQKIYVAIFSTIY